MFNVEDEVRPADSSKPDPNEPYRYVCPECEGQVHSGVSNVKFYCHKCNQGYHKDELLDLNPPTI
jgi:uncharacterized protein (DUF983 family)